MKMQEEEEEEEKVPPGDEEDIKPWSAGTSGEQYREEEEDRLEGENMEKFNMDDERGFGAFDTSGNFNWNRRDLAEEGDDEAWLKQVGDQLAAPSASAAAELEPPQVQKNPMSVMWSLVSLYV
jgi:hypothetical protein